MTSRFKLYANTLGPLRAAQLYLRSKLSGATAIPVEWPGIRAPFYVRFDTSDKPTFHKVIIEQEYAIEPAEPPRLIIDAGANVGYASIYFANRFPDAQIIAVEPEPENFRLLERNTHPYPNIKCLQRGVWSRDCFLKIANPDDAPWAFQLVEAAADDPAALEAVTIRHLLEISGEDRIGILKLDVEGTEKVLFEAGDAQWWLSRTEAIMLELHDRFVPGCEAAMMQAIRDQGFRRREAGENTILQR